uniref:Uncharacterized protein n=1 Tax=Schizophyllum commune (strain H4-8 / FGSC 9210) TaxID=578458 RepID=D8QCS6_SCHCM
MPNAFAVYSAALKLGSGGEDGTLKSSSSSKGSWFDRQDAEKAGLADVGGAEAAAASNSFWSTMKALKRDFDFVAERAVGAFAIWDAAETDILFSDSASAALRCHRRNSSGVAMAAPEKATREIGSHSGTLLFSRGGKGWASG